MQFTDRALVALLFIAGLFLAPAAYAQKSDAYAGALGRTWNNPMSSHTNALIQGQIGSKILERSRARKRTGKATRPGSPKTTRAAAAPRTGRAVFRTGPLNFRPVPDSGVIKQSVDALTSDPKERAQLTSVFRGLKTVYEAEVAKEGKSNNVAAAMTFFMYAASMTYHQTDEPDEDVADGLLEVLEEEMSVAPALNRMTDLEKQKMHDWLIVSGGLLLAGYHDAVQRNDQSQLSDYKQLAASFFKIVFGSGPEKFNLAEMGTT